MTLLLESLLLFLFLIEEKFIDEVKELLCSCIKTNTLDRP